MKKANERILLRLWRILLLPVGVWCAAAAPIVLKLPAPVSWLFALCLALLFFGSFFRWKFLLPLSVIEAAWAIFFLLLTPREQFSGVVFQKVFAVKPSVEYLPGGKVKVVDLRRFRYRTADDFDEIYVSECFDPAKVESADLATVRWGGMDLVAHAMWNFNFSDGKKLAVSVEPRTPVGVDREAFTCLCKQQELLFVLSVPEDLFDLRSKYRGEDLFVYRTVLSRDEAGRFLTAILKKVEKLSREPEFYDLIRANCVTAWLPEFKAIRKDLRCDLRVLFNGNFDRMLFEQGLLVSREGESFESLKSRSFVTGKSGGKL